FSNTHREVTATVELLRAYTTEVTDTWNSDRNQAIQDLIHTLFAQSNSAADWPTNTNLKTCNSFTFLAHHSFLTRILDQIIKCVFQYFLIAYSFTHTHVKSDLGNARHFHYIRQAQLLLEFGGDFFAV